MEVPEDLKKRIAELWDKGMPTGSIAARLGVSAPVVRRYGYMTRANETKRKPREYPQITEEVKAEIRRLWDSGEDIRGIITEMGVTSKTARHYAYRSRNGDGRQPSEKYNKYKKKQPGIREIKRKRREAGNNVTAFTDEENAFLMRISDYKGSVEWRVLGYDDYERVFLEMHGLEHDDKAVRRYMRMPNNGFPRVTERYRMLRKAYGMQD